MSYIKFNKLEFRKLHKSFDEHFRCHCYEKTYYKRKYNFIIKKKAAPKRNSLFSQFKY